jgi:hypothetical protein
MWSSACGAAGRHQDSSVFFCGSTCITIMKAESLLRHRETCRGLDGTTRIIQDLRICLQMQASTVSLGSRLAKWQLPHGLGVHKYRATPSDDVSYIQIQR